MAEMRNSRGARRRRLLRCPPCLLACLMLAAPVAAPRSTRQAQTPAATGAAAASALAPSELDDLLKAAAARTEEYAAVFKDLAAEETKTIELYDDAGRLTRRRRIVSDFVAYQSRLRDLSVSEYRNVREVDGRAVAGRDKRLAKLFEGLAKSKSVERELERVDREGNRYDLSDRYAGLTLHQGLLLADEIRPAMRFEVEGRERVDGREVIVVRYRQVSQTPSVKFDFKLPDALKDSEFSYRGRLWLDALTAQLWREEREVTMRPPSMKDALVIVGLDFRYAPSRFGVLLPQRFVFSSFTHGRGRSTGELALALSTRMTFDYGAFSRFGVGIPEATVNPPDAR